LVLALVPAAVPMLVNGRYLASEHQTFGGFLESAHFSPWEYSEALTVASLSAWRGTAGHGGARRGLAWAWHGKTGEARPGAVRHGETTPGLTGRGEAGQARRIAANIAKPAGDG
jgi:hypothetical protein